MNHADVHEIDENNAGLNDVLLWVKSTIQFIKNETKGLRNSIRNLLNAIRSNGLKDDYNSY